MRKTVVAIGASGTIGRSVVEHLETNHDVMQVSRSTVPSVDMSDTESIRKFYSDVGPVDAIVVCAGFAPFKHVTEFTSEDFMEATSGKLLGQVNLVLEGIPFVKDGGSFTLVSGILTEHPVAGSAAASMANGGVESFAIAASTELPRGQRINVVSPTVLKEATGYHSAFPGFKQVDASDVADAYVRSVDGVESGQIFRVWG